ncbi:MAG: hypothetical protein COV59_00815 [Candidatus Magasanikbacteria bacterium CG11_big_fil_rev_8_21_14_0_20_39_34]|uniref:PRC-barrel domain-containing protein n=1 Tax=Candidatus Magasanikbacteria bacterium CG11_big_fil_rev_8_21_14_0_20_39_34 TaxID=1974653 RepID=A0A2H0N661_9BACT|nr:MAG: hypothetical protein COV59_00815 [Candidatus Magasanikbacteria bacterium CG11_big_fil_rev_8_21_14_0_20_39_34]
MRITLKQLKKVKVETNTGLVLGHIVDIVFDTESQGAVQYRVKGPVLSTKEFLVGRDQVVRFEAERMVVYDSVVKKGIDPKKLEETLKELPGEAAVSPIVQEPS